MAPANTARRDGRRFGVAAARRMWADRSGNGVVFFALAAVPVLGIVGLAMDYGRTVHVKSALQTALDSAVLAGAKDFGGDPVALAMSFFQSNFSDGIGTQVQTTFQVGPGNRLTGTATSLVPATISAILGNEGLRVSVRSEVGAASSRVCVLLLDPTAPQSLLVNSGATVLAPDCEIHVKSTANPAAIFNAGSDLTTKKICIQGASIIDNGGTHPNMQTSCATASDPYAAVMPPPPSTVCDFNNGVYNGGTVTLTPGVYCGWFNFNSNTDVNLDPGVYVIKGGGWNVNQGHWQGAGVTFYFDDTSYIQFNSAISTDLSAPSSGQFAGILFYERAGLAKSPFVFDDSLGSKLQGLFYLPSRNVTFNSDSKLSSERATLVFNTLILDQTKWDLEPDATSIGGSGAGSTVFLVR